MFKSAAFVITGDPVRVCVKSLQSCLTLCNAMDCSLLGSYVCGILQASVLEWVACPPPGDLPDPGIEPHLLCLTCIGRRVLYH